MSNAASNWQFPLPLTGPKKGVLIVLAHHADDENSCWPSIERIALFSGYGMRAVRAAIKELETLGLISIRQSKGYGSNRYIVNVGAPYETRAGDRWHENPAPHAQTEKINPAPHAKEPGTTCTNPAPHAEYPAPGAPELSRTIKELSKELSKPRAKLPTVIIPDWVPSEAWNGYLSMRAERKKAPTTRAVELLIGRLAKFRDDGLPIDAILDESTRNGWTDVYAPKNGKNFQPRGSPREGVRASYATMFEQD